MKVSKVKKLVKLSKKYEVHACCSATRNQREYTSWM